jgi:hypothetical protein
MFRKISVFIDSALRRRIEKDYELRTSEGLAECFRLMAIFVQFATLLPESNYEGHEALRKLLSGSNGEHTWLRQAFRAANRVEVTVKEYILGNLNWEIRFYKKGTKEPFELSFPVGIADGQIVSGITMAIPNSWGR